MRIYAYIIHHSISPVKSKIVGAGLEPAPTVRTMLPCFSRLTGALLASGVASGEVNIVPFSERILTFGCGDGESHGVVTVFGIGMSRVLLGAVDGAIVIEVPGPGGYITC